MVFEYDLPDTLTDEDFDRYYTVSVSLPGWTQKVTNFKFYPAFIPRSGDWIRVEMLPDSSGPADPEKTYLMFFVRDIHANPLERASIEIAGQYWHTNSAGHVAVEVPKNSTTAYTVRKTGHVSISGSAAVGAEGSYVVNIALGPALPDRTPGPGDDPGATPPPRDTRTNEEKGKAVIDLIADNAELIATPATWPSWASSTSSCLGDGGGKAMRPASRSCSWQPSPPGSPGSGKETHPATLGSPAPGQHRDRLHHHISRGPIDIDAYNPAGRPSRKSTFRAAWQRPGSTYDQGRIIPPSSTAPPPATATRS